MRWQNSFQATNCSLVRSKVKIKQISCKFPRRILPSNNSHCKVIISPFFSKKIFLLWSGIKTLPQDAFQHLSSLNYQKCTIHTSAKFQKESFFDFSFQSCDCFPSDWGCQTFHIQIPINNISLQLASYHCWGFHSALFLARHSWKLHNAVYE